MNQPTINERLACYHAAPYAFKGIFGRMLSTALTCSWFARYGQRETRQRMSISMARIAEVD